MIIHTFHSDCVSSNDVSLIEEDRRIAPAFALLKIGKTSLDDGLHIARLLDRADIAGRCPVLISQGWTGVSLETERRHVVAFSRLICVPRA